MRPIFAKALFWTVLLALSVIALRYHAGICRFPYEILPSEAGMAQSARAMRQGLDPWSVSLAPQSFNDYGCVTPALAALLNLAIPAMDPLQGLRWLSALALGLCVWMLYARLRKEGCDAQVSGAAALSFYFGMLYFEGASAKPDAVAIALYLAALFLGSAGGRKKAFGAGVLVALAFFAKTYAVLAGPLAIGGLWVTGRRAEAKAMALGLCTAGPLLLLLVWKLYPLYYWGTIPVVGNNLEFSFKVLGLQWLTFGRLHLPLFVGLIALGVVAWRQQRWQRPKGAAAFWLGSAAGVFLFLASGPGAHPGAFLIYYLQLFYPLFIVGSVLWSQQWQARTGAVALLLALDLISVLAMGQAYNPGDVDALSKAWPKAIQMVAANPHGFYPPIMTTLVVQKGGFVSDNDHTHTLPLAGYHAYRSPLADAALAHFSAIGQGLHEGRFSVAVCGDYWPCPEGAMAGSYRAVGQLCLGSPIGVARCMDVFVPIHPPKKKEVP